MHTRKQLAKAIVTDQDQIESTTIRSLRPILRQLIIRILKAIRNFQPIKQVIQSSDAEILDTMIQGATLAHLTANQRFTEYVETRTTKESFSLISNAVKAQAKRQGGTAQIKSLMQLYKPQIATDLLIAQATLERQLNAALQASLAQGDHVVAGVARMRTAMDAAGLSFDKPFLYETLVRTENAIAYSAASMKAVKDANLSDFWGWEYSAVGDARTRSNHLALDGKMFRKDDPELPVVPRGFNCRCTLIPVFDAEAPQQADKIPVDGQIDKGFVNPVPAMAI